MAAIVNYRDLLLQGAATRYVAPPTGVTVEDLGDLAFLDSVGTGQIQPASITAGSGILAPGAVLTQTIALNAVTDSQFLLGGTADLTMNYDLQGDSGRTYSVFILGSMVMTHTANLMLDVDGVRQWTENPIGGTLATRGHVISLYPGIHAIRLYSDNSDNDNGTTIYALATKR